MKRNLKSILKYFILIIITVLVTSVIFKLFKRNYQNENHDIVQWETNHVDKHYYLSKFSKIDWHDWKFIHLEKQRTGKIVFITLLKL